MDGVRQDFVLTKRPAGASELRVQLAVTGATVESTRRGTCLVLNGSRHKIAYGRLRVVDATGRELPARLEIAQASESRVRTRDGELLAESPEAALAVLVNDADAIYPVLIDPTFSDANWTSMGNLPGADRAVYAAVVDLSGNLYIGGDFTVVGM